MCADQVNVVTILTIRTVRSTWKPSASDEARLVTEPVQLNVDVASDEGCDVCLSLQRHISGSHTGDAHQAMALHVREIAMLSSSSGDTTAALTAEEEATSVCRR